MTIMFSGLVVLLLLPGGSHALVGPDARRSFVATARTTSLLPPQQLQLQLQLQLQQRSPALVVLLAKGSSSDEEDEDKLMPGMAEAFGALEDLAEDSSQKGLPTAKEAASEILSTNASDSLDDDVTPEEEMKLYKQMISELEKDGGEDATYESIMGDMGGTPKKMALDDADGIGSLAAATTNTEEEQSTPSILMDNSSSAPKPTEQDMEVFMNTAFEEAIKEVKLKSPGTPESDILRDAEMMKEIESYFDDASDKLKAGIDGIRKDQEKLSRDAAEARANVSKGDEMRLDEAEASVSRMIGKVDSETREVEKALKDLQEAQSALSADPLGQLSDLKQGGVVKQGALVGALLFAVRSITEAVAIVGDGGDAHILPAAIQGALALALAAFFALA
uniref:Uncharacterized protein n=1 Tax=Attheya septentrionalis TaxID=420275 RepID=A0A7S2UDG9_9STRA|mmetsp:Transcript_20413/g.36970  ORF Transcript_20413/g.36970 Transcript_20413/m.36970 type:complete len:392 (+) Transcript_20413:125-1300(+)